MPEGPSIVILKEEVQQFSGQEVLEAAGNSSIEISRLKNKTIRDFKSWGKHFLICFDDFTIKIHMLMFGTYRINERKEITPRLSLVFANGELNFYTCSIKILEGDINLYYNWEEDVMNKNWDPKKAKQSLDKIPNQMICDALLEQSIFSGVGNIIKNEVLYRCKIHPESLVGNIPKKHIQNIIKESVIYSFQFLEWKKNYELKKHWLAHTKAVCVRCDLPIIKSIQELKKEEAFIVPTAKNYINEK